MHIWLATKQKQKQKKASSLFLVPACNLDGPTSTFSEATGVFCVVHMLCQSVTGCDAAACCLLVACELVYCCCCCPQQQWGGCNRQGPLLTKITGSAAVSFLAATTIQYCLFCLCQCMMLHNASTTQRCCTSADAPDCSAVEMLCLSGAWAELNRDGV